MFVHILPRITIQARYHFNSVTMREMIHFFPDSELPLPHYKCNVIPVPYGRPRVVLTSATFSPFLFFLLFFFFTKTRVREIKKATTNTLM